MIKKYEKPSQKIIRNRETNPRGSYNNNNKAFFYLMRLITWITQCHSSQLKNKASKILISLRSLLTTSTSVSVPPSSLSLKSMLSSYGLRFSRIQTVTMIYTFQRLTLIEEMEGFWGTLSLIPIKVFYVWLTKRLLLATVHLKLHLTSNATYICFL